MKIRPHDEYFDENAPLGIRGGQGADDDQPSYCTDEEFWILWDEDFFRRLDLRQAIEVTRKEIDDSNDYWDAKRMKRELSDLDDNILDASKELEYQEKYTQWLWAGTEAKLERWAKDREPQEAAKDRRMKKKMMKWWKAEMKKVHKESIAAFAEMRRQAKEEARKREQRELEQKKREQEAEKAARKRGKRGRQGQKKHEWKTVAGEVSDAWMLLWMEQEATRQRWEIRENNLQELYTAAMEQEGDPSINTDDPATDAGGPEMNPVGPALDDGSPAMHPTGPEMDRIAATDRFYKENINAVDPDNDLIWYCGILGQLLTPLQEVLALKFSIQKDTSFCQIKRAGLWATFLHLTRNSSSGDEIRQVQWEEFFTGNRANLDSTRPPLFDAVLPATLPVIPPCTPVHSLAEMRNKIRSMGIAGRGRLRIVYQVEKADLKNELMAALDVQDDMMWAVVRFFDQHMSTLTKWEPSPTLKFWPDKSVDLLEWNSLALSAILDPRLFPRVHDEALRRFHRDKITPMFIVAAAYCSPEKDVLSIFPRIPELWEYCLLNDAGKKCQQEELELLEKKELLEKEMAMMRQLSEGLGMQIQVEDEEDETESQRELEDSIERFIQSMW
ncbi:hypothetical protein QBC44DRAFT_406039 [Cladorrhinum sp. PSN332]|nr:hypothetical protein QBC44DRAFT_406039 [Cladorrhinum sp. PSN332]